MGKKKKTEDRAKGLRAGIRGKRAAPLRAGLGVPEISGQSSACVRMPSHSR